MIAVFSLTAADPDQTYMVRHVHDLSSVSVAVAGPHGHSGTGKKDIHKDPHKFCIHWKMGWCIPVAVAIATLL